MSYVGALALTLVIEVPLVVAVRSALLRVPHPCRRVATWAVIANLVSHPLAIGVVWPLTDRSTLALVTIELSVVAFEAIVFSRTLRAEWWPSLLTSGVANAASVAIGVALSR